MIDQTGVNLLALVGTRMKKVAATGGGEYHGACPFCGGKDRFIVQPAAGNGGRWSCRQCSPNWNDSIAFIMQRDSCDFRAACEALRLDLSTERDNGYQSSPVDLSRLPGDEPVVRAGDARTDYECFNQDWQAKAESFVLASYDRLHSPDGERALRYLLERGLSDTSIRTADLGYNDKDRHETWGTVQVWLPRGIVIPWFFEGKYLKVNIRRPTGEPKYIQAKGGANALYGAGGIITGCTAVLVEGEFDALVLRSHLRTLEDMNTYRVAATGTATGSRLLKWVLRVNRARRVLLAFDQDKAGVDAALWWRAALGDNAVRLPLKAHDVTDMYKAGHDLLSWLKSV